MWRYPIINGQDDLLEELTNPKLARRPLDIDQPAPRPTNQEPPAAFSPNETNSISREQRSREAQQKFKEFLQLPEFQKKNLSLEEKGLLAIEAPHEHMFDHYKSHGIDLEPYTKKPQNDALIRHVLKLEAVANATNGIMDPRLYPDIPNLRENVAKRNKEILDRMAQGEADAAPAAKADSIDDLREEWRDYARLRPEGKFKDRRYAGQYYMDIYQGSNLQRHYHKPNPVAFRREFLNEEEQRVYDSSPELIKRHMRQGFTYDEALTRAIQELSPKMGGPERAAAYLDRLMSRSEERSMAEAARMDQKEERDRRFSLERAKTVEDMMRRRYEQSMPKRIQDLAVALGLQGQDPDTVERTMDAVTRAIRTVRDDASSDLQKYGDPVAELARMAGMGPGAGPGPGPGVLVPPAGEPGPRRPGDAPQKPGEPLGADESYGNKNVGAILKDLMGANAYASLSAKAKSKDTRSDEILHEIYSSLGEKKFIDNLPLIYHYMRHVATPGRDRWKEALNVSSNEQFGYNVYRIFGADASPNDTVIKLRNYLGLGMPSSAGFLANLLYFGAPVVAAPIDQVRQSLYDPRLEGYSTLGRIAAGLYNSTRGTAAHPWGPQASDELKLKLVGDLLPWEEKLRIERNRNAK